MEVDEIQPLTREGLERLLSDRRTRPRKGPVHGRRQSARWSFPSTVELWVQKDEHGEEHMLAVSVNLSETGVGIQMDEPLEKGMEVGIAVHEPEMTFHGRAIVRHCTPTGSGPFLVGLQFQFGA